MVDIEPAQQCSKHLFESYILHLKTLVNTFGQRFIIFFPKGYCDFCDICADKENIEIKLF